MTRKELTLALARWDTSGEQGYLKVVVDAAKEHLKTLPKPTRRALMAHLYYVTPKYNWAPSAVGRHEVIELAYGNDKLVERMAKLADDGFTDIALRDPHYVDVEIDS